MNGTKLCKSCHRVISLFDDDYCEECTHVC